MEVYQYMVLNKNNIADSMITYFAPLSNIPDNYIKVQDNTKLWCKYENGQWSTEKFEPISTAPISEFEQLKINQDLMQQAMNELLLGGM